MNSRSTQVSFAAHLRLQSVPLLWRRKPMASFFLKRTHWLLLCLAISGAAVGQLLPTQLTAPTSGSANQSAPDPLGRDTPSGTVFGFLQAAQSGNYSTAAQYLQLSNARRL